MGDREQRRLDKPTPRRVVAVDEIETIRTRQRGRAEGELRDLSTAGITVPSAPRPIRLQATTPINSAGRDRQRYGQRLFAEHGDRHRQVLEQTPRSPVRLDHAASTRWRWPDQASDRVDPSERRWSANSAGGPSGLRPLLDLRQISGIETLFSAAERQTILGESRATRTTVMTTTADTGQSIR